MDVEPIFKAVHILLHRVVGEARVERNARQFGHHDIDHLREAFFVDCRIASEAGGVDDLVERRIDVVAGVEQGIVLPVIGPVEEIVRVIEPAIELGDDHGHRLARHLREPVRPRHLLKREVDADLLQRLLDQNGGRLAHRRLAEVVGERRLESIGKAGLGQELLGLREILAVPDGHRPDAFGIGLVRIAAEHRLGAIVKRGIDDLLVGNRVGDRLAHLRVVEGRQS